MKTIQFIDEHKITTFKGKLKIIKSPAEYINHCKSYFHKIEIIDLTGKTKPEIFYQNH